MEVVGTLKKKFETEKVSARFQKREFILTTEETSPYPQHVSFQVSQDKCGMLDKFTIGQQLKVQFSLRGREWNGPQGIKYFNTLEAWHVDGLANNSPATTVDPAQNYGSDNDDLPF